MRIYSFKWPIFIDLFHLKFNWNFEPGSAVLCSIFLFLPTVLFCCIGQLKLFIFPWPVWLLCFQYYDSFHCALQLPPDSSRLHVEIDPPLCECAYGKPGLMYGIDKHLIYDCSRCDWWDFWSQQNNKINWTLKWNESRLTDESPCELKQHLNELTHLNGFDIFLWIVWPKKR